ncbi:MAG: DUF1638 domain-containing protein [Candidatus Omnitrophica bacterium]|nr:DUF1638 domain-containing protein [Candidatus Omnitrophota bacterium]
MEKKRVGLIACEIFFREIAYYAARGPQVIDAVFLPKGLHDLGGDKMRETIQAEIDKMQERGYSRIILGYALCNNGITGLTGRRISLVVPRAHDCIAVFMGSRKRYQDYFFANTGTYFHTPGWLERGTPGEGNFDSQLGPPQPGRVDRKIWRGKWPLYLPDTGRNKELSQNFIYYSAFTGIAGLS